MLILVILLFTETLLVSSTSGSQHMKLELSYE
jgi:hypothetical protein